MEDLEEEEDFDAFNMRQSKDDEPGLAATGDNSGQTRGDESDLEREERDHSDDVVSDFDREDCEDEAERSEMGNGLRRPQSAKQI